LLLVAVCCSALGALHSSLRWLRCAAPGRALALLAIEATRAPKIARLDRRLTAAQIYCGFDGPYPSLGLRNCRLLLVNQ
jgi:hypothetical protein